MKRSYDKQKIRKAFEQTGLDQCLRSIDPDILICEFAPGELILSPLAKPSNVYFILDGDATVYVLDEKDTMITAARETPGGMIGDPELFFEDYRSAYVEARSRVRVLALPYDVCRRELRSNEAFTYFLIRQILARETRKRQIDYNGTGTRDKVLFYIRNICPHQCLTSITSVSDTVNCSYRQAQRIIGDLTEEGILVRIGKGKYRLGPQEIEK